MEESVRNISLMSISELEKVIDRFPWFSYARQLLLYKLAKMGEECFEQKFKECSAFIHSGEVVFYKTREILASVAGTPAEEQESISLDELSFDNVADTAAETKPKFYIVGGDYFSKDDFEQLNDVGKVEKVGKFPIRNNPDSEISYTTQDTVADVEIFDSPSFLTETLAHIYVEQGYYEQAIDVYAKLILLYPEKSTYFATLVEEIKLKN